MNNNTFLYRVGLNPENFINQDIEPIKTDEGLLYLVEERKDIRICPYCDNSLKNEIKKYYYTNINVSSNSNMKEILQIKRVQYICKNCNKTFTNGLKGINGHNTISEFPHPYRLTRPSEQIQNSPSNLQAHSTSSGTQMFRLSCPLADS